MSQVRHVARMVRRAPRADVVILLVTLLLTVFTDLVVAVNIGVVLAMLHFMRRMSESVVVRREDGAALQRELGAYAQDTLPANVLVYTVEGPFFFAAADAFQRALEGTHTDPAAVIIRLSHVPFIDATGLQALESVIVDLQSRGVHVMLAEANSRVLGKMRRMGLVERLGPHGVQHSVAQALTAWEALGKQATSS
jgi:SulP family sulfate permease